MTIYSTQSGLWTDPTMWSSNTVPDLSVDDVVIVTGHVVSVLPATSLTLYPGRWISVDVGATLALAGSLQLQSGELVVNCNLAVVTSGVLDVLGGGLFVANGSVTVANSGVVYVDADGLMRVTLNGNVDVTGNSYFPVDGTADIFGNLGVDPDSYLTVDSGIMRVFGTLRISGRMSSGSGRIKVVRRDAKILDYAGNSLIAFDRMYGYTTAAIV